MTQHKQIVIVGGGITGLTTAYYLKQHIETASLPYDVKLVEASSRFGGKIRTLRRDGFTIERGPDSFLARKQPAVKLAEALGMENELVRNGTGQSYIMTHDQLHKMPQGAFMGIPTQIKPFLFSGIFSKRGKLKAGMDLVKPKSKPQTDQSLGGFFRHRFGDELVESLVEPLLSGIYAGDIDKMSLMATFPNFYKLEQEYGSLIKGLQKTMPKRKKSKGKKPGMFFSFKGGLESMIERLVEALGDEIPFTDTAVDHIEKKPYGYHILLDNAEVLKADAVVMASPHYTLPNVFSQYDFFKAFNDVPSTSVANVALAFDESDIKQDIDGTGFVISRNSDYRITAVTWTHKKWPHAAPDGKALVRCYVGRPDDQQAVDLSDEEIIDIVMKDLNKTMDIKADPEFSVITRWKNAMPQYTVGHKERLEGVREQMEVKLPGVMLAGSSYEGIGVPDCIAQGEAAAQRVLDFLR
ncbi:protoporphyrinogen oxidase [Lentibacillus sp. JNUCC-1]|uniref:protoporphyrinogen oxidase n=1 Tax=Lentibacillus sp. JNUCC-1 TaxID=2654513 RepID=UPI0012E71CAB|nr:protoporphyrinogen oxidase [Lentibacillus sp. JNUCC-1]